MLSLSLLAVGAPAEAMQRDERWGAVGPGELRSPKQARRAGERMLERAQADRAVPERDARRGAARSSADAQAKCLAAVQKRLEQGRDEAARKRMERCRRRADREIAAHSS
ncbi:hypothetical protein E2493_18775 [Sphingomonas parva]|uniref:Uncharacterized protein n=1 Tax=Sphingomonas parva TaxID=2555898 RepID=A0A4Y8ZL41_9SPHN|nr:hypothetical protein [Sphingomonas parva]TFI56723.1 hypothetical protein E2493_18775 [Sphingomonas parva]